MPSQIELYLQKKRESIQGVDPQTAYEKVQSGEGVIVDTRPQSFRSAEGAIPGALVIER
jgi:hypothetical protein